MATIDQIKAILASRQVEAPNKTPLTIDRVRKEIETRNLAKGNEFTRGLARGTDTSIALVKEGVPALAKSIGNQAAEFVGADTPFDPTENLREYQKEVDLAYLKNPTKYKTFEDVKSLTQVPGYVASAAGETLPSLATSLIGGGAGGLMGKAAIKTMAKRAGKELLEKEVDVAFKKSLLMGSGITSASMNIPESYFNLLQQGKDDPLASVAIGALKTALDIAPEMVLVDKILGPGARDIVGDSLIKRIGKEALTTGAFEGLTEGAQTALDDIAEKVFIDPNRELFSQENINSWIDGALKGAVGGVAAGGAGGALMPSTPNVNNTDNPETTDSLIKKLKPTEQEQVNKMFEEEVISSPILANKKAIQDSSVLPPIYMGEKDLATLDDNGIDKESVKRVPTVDLLEMTGQTNEDSLVNRLTTSTDLASVYTPSITKKRNPKVQNTLNVRNKGISEGIRQDGFFMPGDGEIVVNPQETIDTKLTPIDSPFRKLKVDDSIHINKKVGEAKLQRQANNLGFYSQLENTINTKLPNKGSGASMWSNLESLQKNGNFKNEELEWSGLKEYLAGAQNVTREDIANFVKQGGVKVIDVPRANTRYQDYTLEKEDSINYKEHGLQLPFEMTKPTVIEPVNSKYRVRVPGVDNGQLFDTEEAAKKEQERLNKIFGKPVNTFQESHYGSTPNVLVHWRTSDKWIDGKLTYALEEIQSDWHQQGQEYGYIGDNSRGTLEEFFNSFRKHTIRYTEAHGETFDWTEKYTDADGATLIEISKLADRDRYLTVVHDKDAVIATATRGPSEVGGTIKNLMEVDSYARARQVAFNSTKNNYEFNPVNVPNAPFKNTWSQLGLKRFIRQAAEQGYKQASIPGKEWVRDIQGHQDYRAGHFYENRLLNELKALSKKYGFKIKDTVYEISTGGVEEYPAHVANVAPDKYVYYADYIGRDDLFELPFIKDVIISSETDMNNYENQFLEKVFRTIANMTLDQYKAYVRYENRLDGKDSFSYTPTGGWDANLKDFKSEDNLNSIADDLGRNLHVKMRPPLSKIMDSKATYPVKVIEFTPESKAKILGEGFPLFQRAAPVQGSIEDTIVMPNVIANNLELIELTPTARAKYNDLINNMERIFNEVVGPSAELKPYAFVRDKEGTAFGAQFLNTVALALNPTTQGRELESLYHEMWHQMERHGKVNDAAEHTEKLIDYLAKDEYLQQVPYELLMATPQGREEIRANAFGKWAMEQIKKGSQADLKVPEAIPQPFRKLYRDIMNLVKRVKNMLKANKFNNIEDIFMDVYTGQRAGEVAQNIAYLNSHARLQRIAEGAREVYQMQFRDDNGDLVEEARREANNVFDKKGRIGMWGKWFQSFQDAAKVEPMTAQIFASFDTKINNFNSLLTKYKDIMPDYAASDKVIRYKLHDIMDYCRNTEQKAKVNADGLLTYVRGDNVVVVKDPEIAKKYTQLQEAYSEVLNDAERMFKEVVKRKYPEYITDENFTAQGLNKIIKSFPVDVSDTLLNNMTNLYDQLVELEKMRKNDYVPRMRYGSWGIKVQDRETGDLVDLFTVEDGSASQNLTLNKAKQLYNSFQLDEVFQKIKDTYGDTSKYKIIGGSGEITDFNNKDTLNPFKINYNDLQGNLDPRFLNIETLSALLHSTNIDPAQFEKLRDNLYEDILTRGFKNRFVKSDNVGIGYSKDWDRASHSYFSGASRFFSGVPHAEFLSKFEVERLKMKDEVLAHKLKKYSDYTNSVQEDFQALRTFNFMWTMGGNLSTAVIQLYTLPTMTLGELNKYNPNILQNIATINKNIGIASKYFLSNVGKTVYTNDGMLAIDFGDSSAIERALRDGAMSQAKVNFLLKERIRLRGHMIEDFVGFEPFETRSVGGKAKKALSRTGYYLGLPVSFMEQFTRFVTSMSAFDTFHENEVVRNRALKGLENDYKYSAMVTNRPSYTASENLASYTMDNAHAVFGKYGRSPYMRGVGGGVFFPFTTYVHQMLENLVRMYQYGPDGKRALAVTLTSMFLFGGLMGLPGAELIKELIEALENQLTGSEEDLDLLIREQIYKNTGSMTAGKFVTQGAGRAFFGLDIAKRIGLGVPGTEIMLMAAGIKEAPASEAFGVAGSLIPAMGQAWAAFNEGDISNVFSAVSPAAGGNLIKAAQMLTDGVKTKSGYQLLTQEEVSGMTAALKAFGISSDQVASRREELFYGKILANRKYLVATDRYRAQAKKHFTAFKKAENNGNNEKARDEFEKYKEVLNEFKDFAVANKIPVDMPAFTKSVIQAGMQRTTGNMNMKDLRKYARPKFIELQKTLGTEREKEQE